jgi:hypothetical protein
MCKREDYPPFERPTPLDITDKTPEGLEPVMRCRCTVVYDDEPMPRDWKDVDGDGIIEWCTACDDGIALTYAEPKDQPE